MPTNITNFFICQPIDGTLKSRSACISPASTICLISQPLRRFTIIALLKKGVQLQSLIGAARGIPITAAFADECCQSWMLPESGVNTPTSLAAVNFTTAYCNLVNGLSGTSHRRLNVSSHMELVHTPHPLTRKPFVKLQLQLNIYSAYIFSSHLIWA